MAARLLVAAVLFALAGGMQFSDDGKTVDVLFLGEANCPFTQRFITGALNTTLTTEGLLDFLRFDFLPFGNAYFASRTCGHTNNKGQQMWNLAARSCFNEKCGPAAKTPAQDCFSGQLLCQHGPSECTVNRYFACARKMALVSGQERSRQSYLGYMPFVHCVEDAVLKDETVFQDIHGATATCAASTGVDIAKLRACHDGQEGDSAVLEVAKKTPAHLGVPWLFVNGKAMQADHEAEILRRVCEAFASGYAPKACAAALGAVSKRQAGGPIGNHRPQEMY